MKSPHVSKLEAAQILGVSLRTIDNMVQRGELPVIRCLGTPRIPRRALERLGKSTALAIRRVEPAEVLTETPQPELLLDVLIEQKLAKMAKSSSDAIMEPFFRPKAASDEIKRRQTLPEQSKWKLYYEKFGCLICETRATPHESHGMCRNCYRRTHGRLKVLIGQAEDAIRKRGALIVHDLTAEAQAALRETGSGEAKELPAARDGEEV